VNAIVFFLFYKESMCALLYCKGLKLTNLRLRSWEWSFMYPQRERMYLKMSIGCHPTTEGKAVLDGCLLSQTRDR
jgi:hypothetical protein